MSTTARAATALLALCLASACAAPEPPPPAAPSPPPAASRVEQDAQPAPAAKERDEWVVLETGQGEIWIDLFEDRTPTHAENFKKLVRQGWYDGSPFHRVVPRFLAQGGGRWADGGPLTSDVGYELAAEIRGELRHVRGSVAAARKGDDRNPSRRSSGSQFYICLQPQPEFDLNYTIFGQVIHGLDVVDRLESAPPGKDGLVSPEKASVILRAFLRPATEPGSAAAHDHDDHAGHASQH